jgi:DNA-binding FrmR family transcriptional regulator
MEQESKIHGQIDAGTKPVEERKNCKAVEPREQEINGQIDAGTKPVEERKSCEAMEPTEQEPRTGRRGNKDGGGTEML